MGGSLMRRRRMIDHLAEIQPRRSRREFLDDLAVICLIAFVLLLPFVFDALTSRLP